MTGEFSRTALHTAKTRERYLQTFEQKRSSTQTPLSHPSINHVAEEHEDVFGHTSSQRFPFLHVLPEEAIWGCAPAQWGSNPRRSQEKRRPATGERQQAGSGQKPHLESAPVHRGTGDQRLQDDGVQGHWKRVGRLHYGFNHIDDLSGGFAI